MSCPVCGKETDLERFDDQSGLAHYQCKTIETVKVGVRLQAKVKIKHIFVFRYNGKWVHVDSPKYNKITEHGSWVKSYNVSSGRVSLPTLEDFAKTIGFEVEVFKGTGNSWMTGFKDTRQYWCYGDTELKAINNFTARISGYAIVVDGRSIQVPKLRKICQ